MATFLEISTAENRLSPETIEALQRAGHLCVGTVVGFDAARAHLIQIIKAEIAAPQVYVVGLAPAEIRRLGARMSDTKEAGYLVARSDEALLDGTPAFTQVHTTDDLLPTLNEIDASIADEATYAIKPPEAVER